MITLPYKIENGLLPLFSPKALNIHYNKVYFNHILRLNQLIQNTEHESKSLEDIIESTSQWADDAQINCVASEAWNHAFFFSGLIPGGSSPGKKFLAVFDLHFNGFDRFKQLVMIDTFFIFPHI
jgi:Fe-Mn family superoxide dismutase